MGPCYTRSRLASALSFAGLAQPRALGLLCPRRQSNQNAAGDTPDPGLVQSVCIRGDTGQPLKYCKASGSLVIGQVENELRLSALGMMDVSEYAAMETSLPSKGRQPKPDKKPAADQMTEGFGSSVATQRQTPPDRLGK